MKYVFKSLILLLVCLAAVQGAPRDRGEIADSYKWNLGDIYSDWSAWESDLATLESSMNGYAELEGSLAQGSAQLLTALQQREQLGLLSERVYTYAALTRDLDNRDNEVYARLQQVQILMSRFGTATSWFNPELLAIPSETIQNWFETEPDLAPYRFGIENLFRLQTHVLDADQEKLLSYFAPYAGIPNTIHTQLSTADIQFPTVTLSTGEETQISEGGYQYIIATNRNQADRRLAMEGRNGVYNANINTYAAIYNGICQRDWAYAQARNYTSCVESSLEGNNIPVSVYTSLVEAVREGTKPLQRYHELRRQALKLDSYHFYDTSIPVIEIEKDYPYEEVRDEIVNSMKPLGRAYQKNLKQAFSPGWVDVYETEGKSTGAYSWGVYGVHPYMLLNYNNTLNNVFTVAHEMGHTVHTMFSWEEQPYTTSDYTLFVAEVASTMAEAHFLDYLLEKSDDPRERLVLLSHAMNNIDGTFYTQGMFADFEYQTHKLVEEGQPITADVLNGIYRSLLEQYYGDAITHDELYDITWTRIGHFFFAPFYVYQYATSFAASAALYEQMNSGSRSERKTTVNNYIELLQSGGSDFPVNQLQKAGVDMTQPLAVDAVIARMTKLVDQFETELRNLELID